MNIIGLTFVLYYLKLSDGNGFWRNIRLSDENLYKKAVDLERISKKLQKAKQDLSFLYDCRNEDLHPKFTRWKNFKTLDNQTKRKSYRKVLNDAIKTKHATIKELTNLYSEKDATFRSSTTWMKSLIILNAIHGSVNASKIKTEKRLQKKLQNLQEEKSKRDGLIKNPNHCILNLTDNELTTEQYNALQYGLKYGIANTPNENDLIASAESLWEQLERSDLLSRNFYKIQRAKNCLRGLVFNFLNFNDRRIRTDAKRIEIIKNLCIDNVLLRPDKGSGVVLLKRLDYVNKIDHLFSDRDKFRKLSADPTPTRLSTLQSYLLKLYNRGEISDEVYKRVRPKNAKPARAHGLPKTHKSFDVLPSFRPIIDTTGTTHYEIGKYLCELLTPLA